MQHHSTEVFSQAQNKIKLAKCLHAQSLEPNKSAVCADECSSHCIASSSRGLTLPGAEGEMCLCVNVFRWRESRHLRERL